MVLKTAEFNVDSPVTKVGFKMSKWSKSSPLKVESLHNCICGRMRPACSSLDI